MKTNLNTATAFTWDPAEDETGEQRAADRPAAPPTEPEGFFWERVALGATLVVLGPFAVLLLLGL